MNCSSQHPWLRYCVAAALLVAVAGGLAMTRGEASAPAAPANQEELDLKEFQKLQRLFGTNPLTVYTTRSASDSFLTGVIVRGVVTAGRVTYVQFERKGSDKKILVRADAITSYFED